MIWLDLFDIPGGDRGMLWEGRRSTPYLESHWAPGQPDNLTFEGLSDLQDCVILKMKGKS